MAPSEKLRLIARLQGELLRDQGCGHPDWYAEMLFAAAFDGMLMPTNHPKYDMQTKRWGTVQVKCRVNGTDTTQNRSNFGRYEIGDFDNAAIVLFESNFHLRGAIVLPCNEVLSLVRPAGHVKWEDAKSHPKAVSVLAELQAVSEESVQPNPSIERTSPGKPGAASHVKR